jgi:hypothetical protein
MSAQPEEIIEAEMREIALRPSTAPATLFGTSDPAAFVAHTTDVAKALADVLNRQKLYSVIQGRKFISVEGWTFLGSMVGIFPVTRWTRPIEINGLKGWEARVEAVTRNGEVVGSAESMCLHGESSTWTDRSPANAVRSMAQTRATSKALRQPLDFLVKLAGYATTPAEEMVTVAEPATPTEPSKAQQEADDKLVARTQKKHEQGIGATRAAKEATEELKAESIAELYEDAVSLGLLIKIKQLEGFGNDPNSVPSDQMRTEVIGELNKRCLRKYGMALDKLNSTHLQKVVEALAENLETL